MLLEDKRLLVSGALTEDSVAFAVAERAMREGAQVVLAGVPGRPGGALDRVARRLPAAPAAVVAADTTRPESVLALAEQVGEVWGYVDGLLHAVAYAPEVALGGDCGGWEEATAALNLSVYSLKNMTAAVLPLLEKAPRGASVVAVDFDARHAWPVYDWMGVAKASVESVARHLARDLGPLRIRVNTLAAGPLRAAAGRAIPGFEELAYTWETRAPLSWDTRDATVVADGAVFLFSELSRRTTGTALHVDGGFHALGASLR